MTLGDDLEGAWRATEHALPEGWLLDSLRCTSTGLQPGERADRWRAIALGSNGDSLEGSGIGPIEALADLVQRLRLR